MSHVNYGGYPPDRSEHRTWRGSWRARPKPHLRLFMVDGVRHWQAIALMPDGITVMNYIGETPLEACCAVLGGQQDFWDGRTR